MQNLPCALSAGINLFIRNHSISNSVLDSLKLKKLLELHVFYKKLLYKQLSTTQPEISETFRTTRLFIRNHVISNSVLDSLKFKKLLDLHSKS